MLIDEITNGESASLEFKRSMPEEALKVLKTACAFANCSGGRIVVGVDDEVAPTGAEVAPTGVQVAPTGAEVAPTASQLAQRRAEVAQKLAGKGRSDAIENAVSVYAVLAVNGDMSIAEIESQTKLANRSIKNAFRLLRLNGVIAREGGTYGGKWVVLI